MSKKLPEASQSDEVDFIEIFNYIGKGFEKLFNFVGGLFKGLFEALISVLIYIKANLIKIAIPIALAGLLGLYMDYKEDPIYASTMVVRPNFMSNVQLYDNVNYLNELSGTGDSIALGNALQISSEEAADIVGFGIEAVLDNNTRIKFYDNFISDLDSIMVDNMLDFDFFTDNMPQEYFSRHKIYVYSNNQVFNTTIQDAIVSSVDDNAFFDRQKKTMFENINSNVAVLQKQIAEVEDLRKIYNEVLIEETKTDQATPAGGTNISFAEKTTRTKELELFNEARLINKKLQDLNDRKSTLENTVTILSNLQPIGYEEGDFYDKKAFKVTIAAIILVLFFILLFEANRYIEKRRKVIN